MKKIVFTLIFLLAPYYSAMALEKNTEITCSPEMVNKYSCNQCFDGGYLYENYAMPLADIVTNNGLLEADYYQNELVMPTIHNRGAWFVTFNTPSFKIADEFTTNGLWDNGKWENYTYLNPGDSFRWIETKPGFDLGFSSINKSFVTDANRQSIRDSNFTVVYTLRPRYWDNVLWTYTPATSDTHVECQQIGAHFCGDGYLDTTEGEKCDDGAANGQPGSCNVSCTWDVPETPTPSCDTLTASPTFGNSPVTTTLTCNGSNLPAGSTYAITCGDGNNAAMSGNAGTCTYTNNSPDKSVTYSPKCTINGTLTAPTCQTNVGINPPPPPAACIPGTATGSQSAPVTATTPGLCLDGSAVGGFTSTVAGTVTTYNWSCGGSAVGGLCAATFDTTSVACVPNTVSWVQTAPVTVTTPGLCQDGVTVGDFTATTVGTLTTYNWSCGGSAVGGSCAATYDTSVSSTEFDLSLKKYIGENDAQDLATGVSTTTNSVLNYIIRVTNSGANTSGTTTVQDILPTGVEYDTAATGTGWTCSVPSASRTLTCTSTQVVAWGSSYPDIRVPFRVTATSYQNVTNIAAVDNPGEIGRCISGGGLPATDTALCTLDTTNSDPAVLYVPCTSWCSSSPSYYYVPSCVNGIRSCSTQVHNSIPGCQLSTWQTCYSDLTSCNTGNTLSCGSCTGGGCGPTPPSWFCGDGVLGSSPWEECDVVWASWCVACKIKIIDTTPGANPILSMSIQIPALAGTKNIGVAGFLSKPLYLGSTSSDHQIVVGKDTNVFSLADQLIFDVTTKEAIPIILPEDKTLCLRSSGTALNSNTICTTFGSAWAGIKNINGKNYVVLGNGSYQVRDAAGNYSDVYINPSLATHRVKLFEWYKTYTPLGLSTVGPTLRDAFLWKKVADDGDIALFGCYVKADGTADCNPTAITDMIHIPVRVSGAVISSVGSSSNRVAERFVDSHTVFSGFLWTTVSYTATTTNNNVTTTTTVTVPTITGRPGGSISTVAQLVSGYAVNGNPNVFAVNGDLTINCPTASSVFTMDGTRTVIINGNLIIKCNIAYGSADSASSWAWISQGWNIIIDPTVTSLAGVYAATVWSAPSTTGFFRSLGWATTQAILRVEGTFYGKATPLLDSRIYARATGAYDILTTGTIFTYSNRALVSPPPLLSRYLGAYQLERVVQ